MNKDQKNQIKFVKEKVNRRVEVMKLSTQIIIFLYKRNKTYSKK